MNNGIELDLLIMMDVQYITSEGKYCSYLLLLHRHPNEQGIMVRPPVS